MKSRREFLVNASLALASAPLVAVSSAAAEPKLKKNKKQSAEKAQIKPIVVSTWNHGLAANEAAWKILNAGGKALDAVEKGVMVSEADPEVTSVGLGGYPDRDGKVTLDACIMDENANCGSVTFLENIVHPVSVARYVMERTPHVILSGEGAYHFAIENGFKKENLLTEKSKKAWKEWLKTSHYTPADQHDTIGMLAIDSNGNMSGACTTSGLAWKIHGRVGDSPIIGAGLYVDNEVGAACATGRGEAVLRICGSFLIVELMRQGATPEEACKEAINRIAKKEKNQDDLQVGFIALNKYGEMGGYAFRKGFQIARFVNGENKLIDTEFLKA